MKRLIMAATIGTALTASVTQAAESRRVQDQGASLSSPADYRYRDGAEATCHAKRKGKPVYGNASDVSYLLEGLTGTAALLSGVPVDAHVTVTGLSLQAKAPSGAYADVAARANLGMTLV